MSRLARIADEHAATTVRILHFAHSRRGRPCALSADAHGFRLEGARRGPVCVATRIAAERLWPAYIDEADVDPDFDADADPTRPWS